MSGTFRPLGQIVPPITGQPRWQLSRYREFRSLRDGFSAFFPEEVVQRALTYSRRAYPNEWMGRLVGETHEDRDGIYVVVHGLVRDPDASVSPVHAESSPIANGQINELCERVFDRAASAGWAHGHTGCSATYSDTDRQNQLGWPDPWALGLVVDPWGTPEVGVYRGPDSERLDEILPVEPKPKALAPGPKEGKAPRARPRRQSPRWALRRRRWVRRCTTAVSVGAVVAAFLLEGLWITSVGARVDALSRRATQAPGRAPLAPTTPERNAERSQQTPFACFPDAAGEPLGL